MADDALDGKLGGEAKPPARGSMADLTARAHADGFPTVAAWVDNLEDIVARYEGRRGMVEKVGSRAPDAGVHFAAGEITKDDFDTGWLTHREWERRRSQLPPGQWASAALEPLDGDGPRLLGVDDLREERDQ